MKRVLNRLSLVALSCAMVWGCQENTAAKELNTSNGKEEMQDSASPSTGDDAPYLSPQQAMQAMQTAPGFSVELVAAEPLVHDPIAIAFDAKGQMWVVEMTTYMNDIYGSAEVVPLGTISVITDKNGDGKLDTRHVVVDKVVLPRAVLPIEGGILYADHDSLFFVELDGVKAKSVVMVDDDYVYDKNANVEHRPNGLILGMDNWIHNAKSINRYRVLPLDADLPRGATETYRNERFKIVQRRAPLRGQFGMDFDDVGRLFYTFNSVMIGTDRVDPFYASWFKKGLNGADWVAKPTKSEVFPLRPSPGTNRALNDGMLDDEGKLVKATGASGKAIYRSAQYPAELYGASFTCEPVAFLCSAHTIQRTDTEILSQYAYEKAEFLSSTEERFRPVNINVAPDGSLYIVDMHRGVIQHSAYMTEYLKEYSIENGLEENYNTGRIYRVRYNDNPLEEIEDLNKASIDELVVSLSSKNVWRRNTARRLIIDRGDIAAANLNQISELSANDTNAVTAINALWTLEGLDALLLEHVLGAIKSGNADVQTTGLRLALEQPDDLREQIVSAILKADISVPKQSENATYLALLLSLDKRDEAISFIPKIWNMHESNSVLEHTLLASFYEEFYEISGQLSDVVQGPDLVARLQFIKSEQLAEQERRKNTKLPKGVSLGTLNQGKALYEGEAGCAGCHGMDGNGVVGLAPPIAGSEWATGNKDRLIALVLRGMQGPVTVKGKVFDEGAIMPALVDQQAFGDSNRTWILNYIRNAWGNNAGPIGNGDVTRVRTLTQDQEVPFTEEELLRRFPD